MPPVLSDLLALLATVGAPTAHDHTEHQPGCVRCDLSRHEAD